MNKYALYIVAVLLAACNNDVLTDAGADVSPSTDAIRFQLADDALTRGTPVTSATITDGSFRIYATTERDGHKAVFIDYDAGHDNTVSYVDGSWQTATTYFWPYNSYSVDFYAVYPSTAGIPLAANLLTTPSLTFTGAAGSMIDGNTDLLVAKTTESRGDRTADSNEAVLIDFSHALSQISFKGMLNEPFQLKGYHVSVKGIALRQVNCAGTLDMTQWTTTTDGDGNPRPMLAATAFTPDVDNEGYPNYNVDYTFPMEVTEITDTAVLLSADVAMLMPQTLKGWLYETETIAATHGCYIDVLLHITNAGGDDLLGTAADYAHAYVPLAATWQPGKHYAYTLSFGGGYDADGHPYFGLTAIGITTTVSDWISGGDPIQGQAHFE